MPCFIIVKILKQFCVSSAKMWFERFSPCYNFRVLFNEFCRVIFICNSWKRIVSFDLCKNIKLRFTILSLIEKMNIVREFHYWNCDLPCIHPNYRINAAHWKSKHYKATNDKKYVCGMNFVSQSYVVFLSVALWYQEKYGKTNIRKVLYISWYALWIAPIGLIV